MISGQDVISDSIISPKDADPMSGLKNYPLELEHEKYVCVSADPKPKASEMQLGMFDRYLCLMWTPLLLVYENVNGRSDFMEFETMRKSLALALGRVPIMSGQLSRDALREKIVIGEGAWFCEEKTDLDFKAVKDNLSYEHPPSQARFRAAIQAIQSGVAPPVFSAKILRFPCGSVMLTLLYHHLIVDGTSMSDFARAWSLFARGEESHLVDSRLDPLVLPKSLALQKTRASESHEPPTEMIMSRIEIPVSKLLAFKSESKEYLSIDDIFNAIVWRALTQSRPSTEKTHLRRAVNIRRLITPKLPDDAFGNFVETRPSRPFSSEKLSEMSLLETALEIRGLLKSIDKEYITSLQAYLSYPKNDVEMLDGYNSSIDLISTCHARFYQHLDFHGVLPLFAKCELLAEGMLLTVAPYKDFYLAYITLRTSHALELIKNKESKSYGMNIVPVTFHQSDCE